MTDIVTLILADHVRARRLFAELEAAGDHPPRLAGLWAELAWLLEAHVDASREITYLPLPDNALRRNMREAADDDDDIREAIAEARLHQAGSDLWWLAVRAAHAATDRHNELTESSLLPRLRQQMPEEARLALGQQWAEMMTARRRDSLPASLPGRRKAPTSAPDCRRPARPG